jgi:hypothetical protein
MFRKPKPAVAPDAGPPPAPPPGAPLFDPAWYARHAVDPKADPLDDYLSRGSRAARSPAPFFSPAWYRATNPDIAVLGEEPLLHWLAHGWRERRDPSPLFSTRAYLEARPGLETEGLDPLTHYLASGRAQGDRPHPNVDPFDPAEPDIALVMVHAGDRASLELAVWSLIEATGRARVTLYLVDDGHQPARDELDAFAAAQRPRGLEIRRHSHAGGRSFGACANAGIWLALRERRHTHVGLIEQACLVTRGLFDGLVDLWAGACAPVLNRATTEQAVPVDLEIYETARPLEALHACAAARREIIPGAAEPAEAVEPALVLLQRGALEAAGLLDEAARTPREALAPVLAGLRAAGLGAPVIARHLYAHRLERSPVVADEPPAPLSGAAVRNLQGMPLSAASARALSRSAEADRRGLRGWTGAAARLLEAHEARIEAVSRALDRSEARLRGRLARLAPESAAGPAPRDWEAGQPAEIAFGDPPRPPRPEDDAAYRRAYRRVQHRLWGELFARDLTDFRAFRGMQPLCAALAALGGDEPPVLVLTMDTDPVTGDEKDGYVQRVVAIDKALAPRPRIYLKMVAGRRGAPALAPLEPDIWRLEIAHRCEFGEAALATLLGLGAPVYSQSLVGIDPPVVRRLLPRRTGPLLMDMHGAVPEEFVLYGNHFMAQKYAEHEAWAAREADTVVCVTEEMARHFARKLGIPPARSIVCPVFLHARTSDRRVEPYNDRPRAIYAGGTQRWQMIPELAGLVSESRDWCDWVLLTGDVAGMRKELARARVPAGAEAVSVRSASQAGVFATYPRCDFGLLLREEDVVNRVACPTKLVEYLRFGVVPVLATPHVGDFAEMGMRYLAVEDFRAGAVPDLDERAEMAEANRRVFDRLLERSRNGQLRIARAVRGRRGARPARHELRSTA